MSSDLSSLFRDIFSLIIGFQTFTKMATVLPPPSKRQRTDAAERARQQQDIEEVPSDAGSLRIQFFDETTGLPIGDGPVLVPVADASPKNLELLLNTLQGHASKILCENTEYSLMLKPGLLRTHTVSFYPPCSSEKEYRNDYDCISCQHLEDTHQSRTDQYRRNSTSF